MRKKRIDASHRHLSVQHRCGQVISLAGILVIFGWIIDSAVLKSLVPGFMAMNPVIAANFVLFGGWLLLNSKPEFKGTRYLTFLILLANSFVAILKLTEGFFPPGIEIDRILFPQMEANKIPPASILNLAILNAAFIFSLSRSKNKEYFFQALVLCCLVISSVYLCGYLFNYSSLIGASVLRPMALNTSICFIALSVGLLFSYPDKGYMRPIMSKKLGGTMARRIIPFLLFTPMVTGALRLWGQRFNFYNTELGVAIFVIATAFLSFILSYYFARRLNEIDTVRKLREDELREKTILLHQSEVLLEQTAGIAKVGGWEISLPDKSVSCTTELYKVTEMDEEKEMGFEDLLNCFGKESGQHFLSHFEQALKDGKPFEIEAKILKAKKHEIWVNAKARTIFNTEGEAIAIGGTFQDIDEAKKKELLLEESLEIINEQNKRLMNFTHIVSHNLRTHAGNIKSTLSIYEEEESAEEKAAILEMTKSAADSLQQTITDLNEIVATQSASKHLRSRLYFEDVFLTAKSVLDRDIKTAQAIIVTDFSACPEMDYVAAYLESIFHNFISNAIKYRRPDVPPEIKVCTNMENGKVAMTFSDNGLGIDLEKYKAKLFGMYKTFHNHPDSTGVGLFLTKNQVESLGGNIAVDSQVNVGTTFKILF